MYITDYEFCLRITNNISADAISASGANPDAGRSHWFYHFRLVLVGRWIERWVLDRSIDLTVLS